LSAALCLLAAWAIAGEVGVGRVAERAGGLLPCEAVPGEAVTRKRPDPIIVPRADGGATALFFHTPAIHSKRPMQVVFFDLASGKSRVEEFPGLSNPWSQAWGPDGRLYFGLWGPAAVYRYNPATDRIEQFGVIEPTEKNVPHLTVGTDNKVYGMTSNQGHVFSIDPATDEVIRYGRQGEKRTFIAYSGSIAVDDEFIYTTLGNVEAETRTLAMNKRTREVAALKEITGAGLRQGPLGVTASHGGKEFWLYQGKAIPRQAKDEKPPWPDRPLPQRKVVAFKGKPEVSPIYEAGTDGTISVWSRSDPKAAWQSGSYKVAPEPVALSRCALLPDGRLFASTVGYEGIYTLDPKSDKLVWEGWAPISHYSTLIHDGQVYLANYPGGHGLFVWDPAKPCTLGKGTPERPAPEMNAPESNPRRLEPWAREGNFQFPKYFVQGTDGTMFVGIHGERHNVGSTLSWRNLGTKETGFLREPFELYDVCGMATALGGTKLAYATFPVRGVKGESRPESGRIFLIDVATRKVDWFIEPFPKMDSCGMVVEGRPGELLLATNGRPGGGAGSTLYSVDTKARAVTRRAEFAGVLATPREYFGHIDFVKGADGQVYTLYDDLLVRINPATLTVTALSKVGHPGHIAFVGRDIYLTGLSHFRRVRKALGD
jgi:outer membrane protein assembly factor BamB